MENVDSTRAYVLLGLLEEEQHQTKAQLGRFQHQLEQLVNFTREQAVQFRAVQDELAAARNQLSRLSVLDDLVRQLRELAARLQAAYAEHLQETDKDSKSRQADAERTRQSINDLWQRFDSMSKDFDPLLSKVQAMSDTTKRHQEVVAELVKNVDNLQKQSETLTARLQIASEQGKRSEEETERINRQLDTLRAQDDVVTARLRIITDKLKQIDEHMPGVMTDEQLRVDLSERLQVLKLEQQRLEKQVTDMAPLVDICAARLDEQARGLRQVDERRQLVADDLSELKQILRDQTARLENCVIGVEELEERHKRRQITELEIQANELKGRIAKLKGQGQ